MGKENSNSSNYIKVGIVLLFMFGFRFLPPIGGITPYGMSVLGILIGAILGWSFDSQTMLHTSLLALVALATTAYPGGMEAICTNLMAQSSFEKMDPRDATVLKMRYGIGEYSQKTLKEIGAALGLTRERVRQIETDAIVRLAEMFEGRNRPE